MAQPDHKPDVFEGKLERNANTQEWEVYSEGEWLLVDPSEAAKLEAYDEVAQNRKTGQIVALRLKGKDSFIKIAETTTSVASTTTPQDVTKLKRPEWWLPEFGAWPPLTKPRNAFYDDQGRLISAADPGGTFDIDYYYKLQRSFEPKAEKETGPRPLEQIITDAIIAGERDKALDFDNFRRRVGKYSLPLGKAEALRLAIDYATSPADYFTLLSMVRGERPAFAQPGAFERGERIGPRSATFDVFGFGEPTPGITGPRIGEPGYPGLEPGGAQGPEVTGAPSERRVRLPDDQQAAIDAGQIPPPPGYDAATGTVPLEAQGAQTVLTADQRLAQDPVYQSIQRQHADLLRRWQNGEIDAQTWNQQGNALRLAGQERARELRGEAAQTTFGPAGQAILPQSQAILARERTRFTEPASFAAARQGGGLAPSPTFAFNPSLLPSAVKAVGGLGGQAIGPAMPFSAIGGPTVPSAQAWRNFLPAERAIFLRAVQQQGIPLEDWLEQFRRTSLDLGPERGELTFLPERARI